MGICCSIFRRLFKNTDSDDNRMTDIFRDDEITLYHHTDINSAKLILESGKILQSNTKAGDAVFGEGTYLTSLGPKSSEISIAKNNYDGGTEFWTSKLDKTRVILEIRAPFELCLKCPDPNQRDVYVYRGDIPISMIKKVYIRVENTPGGFSGILSVYSTTKLLAARTTDSDDNNTDSDDNNTDSDDNNTDSDE